MVFCHYAAFCQAHPKYLYVYHWQSNTILAFNINLKVDIFFSYKRCSVRSLALVACCGESCLIYVICVCLHIVVSNTYCIARCFCFVFLRPKTLYYLIWLIYFCFFNATFSNISAISWRPVLVVEEAGVPGENHRPWASNW